MKRLLGWSGAVLLAVCLAGSGASVARAELTNLPPLVDPAEKQFHTEPSGDDAPIAVFVSTILSRNHYRRQPFNEQVSEKFFDQYLDYLDPSHLLLFQSDVAEFERFRKVLHQLTQMRGDTRPAHLIFERYIQRLDQQTAFVKELLRTNQFTFDGDDTYVLDRKKTPRPANLREAQELWRDRIRFEYLQEKLNKEQPEEIVKRLTRRYKNVQRFFKEFDGNDVLQSYLNSLARVYDPHSDYMGRNQAENFKISLQLSLSGIGAQLAWDDGYCKINMLMPGGPAEQCKKLHPNDRIIAVAQGDQEPVDIVDMKLDKAVQLIRGPKGTEVRLTIIPANATDPSVRRVVTLIRDEIKLEKEEAKAKIIDLTGTNSFRLGIIDLPSFYAQLPSPDTTNELKLCATDVQRLLTKLRKEKVDGIVLDLRQNGGGSLEEAIRLTGLFIGEGPVVQQRDWNGSVAIATDDEPEVSYDGPLVVLTSRHSASASEILAGALQDYDRALVVGDVSTHGKGTVQQLMRLEPLMRQYNYKLTNNPGELKFTIRKFYRVNGTSTQLEGVTPDVVLPSVNNYAEIGEKAIPGALPNDDTIPSAKYQKLGRVSPYRAELLRRSQARVTADPDYQYLSGVIERYRKSIADKALSLNEEKRAKEKAENTARVEARKKELKARLEPTDKVYDITLKWVDKDGLPAPTVRTNLASSGNAAGEANSALAAATGNSPHPMDSLTKPAVTLTSATTNAPAAELDARGTGTNTTALAGADGVKAKKSGTDDEDEVEEDVPEIDMAMNEARNILCDLIRLSRSGADASGLAVKNEPSTAAQPK